MRTVSSNTTAAWKASFKGGSIRPMMRATVQKMSVIKRPYDLAFTNPYNSTTVKEYDGSGTYRSMMFGQQHVPAELPNLASIQWSRSVDSEVASCTIQLYNTSPLPLGQTPDNQYEFDRPGYFTPTRGAVAEGVARWGQQPNEWQSLLAPDRIIRTYEGYGFDASVPPEEDPNMYPSGVWLIDDVMFTADGMITLQCRDLGRVLTELICYPPIIPWSRYPLIWDRYHYVDNPDKVVTSTNSDWVTPTYGTDSNKPYIGKGLRDGNMPYVDSNGGVLGHDGADAFDGSLTSYWLSVGNYPTWSSAYEYVEGNFSGNISAAKVNAWGGPYRVYVSVMSGNKWQGRAKIPYVSRLIDTGADIPYVVSTTIGKNAELVIKLPKTITAAQKVRITFSDLYNTGIGQYKWRAGCKRVQVLTTDTVQKTVDGGKHVEGNYADYTDIVKTLLAWSGFHWPANRPHAGGTVIDSFIKLTDGSSVYMPPPSNDPVLGTGRVWGDMMSTNAAGPATLGYQIFDKKPILDCIAQIRDIVGYNFYIDETGGAIFRCPNIWSLGNYVSGGDGGPNVGFTNQYITIDERETLLGMSTQLSSRSIRERIFVGNFTGQIGALAAGFNPYPSGLERVAGWTDVYFATEQECQIMADLIAVRSMFNYRMNSITIPGNPAIQIDDQVKIYERVTNDSYFHYVRGITCEWDLSSGRYTYTLDTHWLGEQPFQNWIVDPSILSQETQQYLKLLGVIGKAATV